MEINLGTLVDLRMGRQSCRNLISDLATQSELKRDKWIRHYTKILNLAGFLCHHKMIKIATLWQAHYIGKRDYILRLFLRKKELAFFSRSIKHWSSLELDLFPVPTQYRADWLIEGGRRMKLGHESREELKSEHHSWMLWNVDIAKGIVLSCFLRIRWKNWQVSGLYKMKLTFTGWDSTET